MINNFKLARKEMSDAFQRDLYLGIVYVSNIAMHLQDRYDMSHHLSNQIAEEIMTLLFDVEFDKLKKKWEELFVH